MPLAKLFGPSPDDVDHLLKLTRCEFGRDLVSRAVYGDQEQGCRNRRRRGFRKRTRSSDSYLAMRCVQF